MRYSNDEDAILVGIFKPNQNVKIKVLNLQNDLVITLKTDTCLESASIPGVYRWSTTSISDDRLTSGFYNLFYEMTGDNGVKFYGKFIYGGYVDSPVEVNLTNINDDHKEIIEKLDIITALT